MEPVPCSISSSCRRRPLVKRFMEELESKGDRGPSLLAKASKLAESIEKQEVSTEKLADYETPIVYCLFAKHRYTGLPMLALLPHNWSSNVQVKGGDPQGRPVSQSCEETGENKLFQRNDFRNRHALANLPGSAASTTLVIRIFSWVISFNIFYCRRVYKTFENVYEGNETEEQHALFDLVADYTDEVPGTLPPSSLFYFVACCSRDIAIGCRNFVPRLLEGCGANLGPATDENWLEETQLMEFVRYQQTWTTTEVLTAFMLHVPRAREAVNMQHPVDGTTAAHICVRRSKFGSLKVLLENGADISNVKDRDGRSVVDLAVAFGKYEELVKAILGASPQPAPLFNFSGVNLGSFPKVYLPSAPDLSSSNMSAVMLEYVNRELPQLVSMDPALVILPPIDEEAGATRSCPYEAKTPGAQGWESEMMVVRAITKALEELLQEQSDLHITCFHGLRYGGKMPELGNWETDFDIVVMIRNEQGGLFAVMMVEIKSITRQKDIVRDFKKDGTPAHTIGIHAINQLCNHFNALRALVRDRSITPEWVIPILAAPSFPSTKTKNGETDNTKQTAEEEEVARKWDAFLETCEASNDSSKSKAYAEIRPRLMTRFVLETPGELKEWFRRALNDISDDSSKILSTAAGGNAQLLMDNRKRAFETIVAWCVAHCFGVAMQQISDRIEKETLVALLTVPQKWAYDVSPSSESKPLLIVGTAGTGKTLLAVAKLIRCYDEGLIKENARGLFLAHAENTGLIALVKRMLRQNETKFIEVRPLTPQIVANLELELSRAVDEKFRFVVIDQLEDMIYPSIGDLDLHEDYECFVESLRKSARTLTSLMQFKGFDMLWATVNPVDLPEAVPHMDFWAFYKDHVNCDEIRILHLNRRIRNTTCISVTVGNLETGEVFLPLHFGAKPVDVGGNSASIKPSRLSIFGEFFSSDGKAPRALAKVVNQLSLKGALQDKHITIINVKNEDPIMNVKNKNPENSAEKAIHYLKEMDQALLEGGFCEPSAIPSMAPLLVHAAWTGQIKETLEEENLEARVKKCFLDSASVQCPQGGRPEEVSLRDNLRRLMLFEDDHCAELEQWLHNIPEDICRSVTFQATMSLVIRYIGYANRSRDQQNKKKAEGFWTNLEQAISAKTNDKGLIKLIDRQARCISVLNYTEVRGYEAEVVIFADYFNAHRAGFNKPAQLLSRAKVMAVLLSLECHRAYIESRIGPLPSLV